MDILQSISEFKRSNVRIKNPSNVERILANMRKMGKDKLQVVSDFDRTITQVSSPTSTGILKTSNMIPEDLKQQFQDLFDHYFPIEHCHVMSIEEKTPHMIEWWNKTRVLFAKCPIKREGLRECVIKSITHLRTGCKEFFESLDKFKIPCVIFSAGLGDVIVEWIEHECGSAVYSKMKIVSNFMVFDPNTKLIQGFADPMIHIFNKNESVLTETDDEVFEKELASRPNVILIGDSLGDVDMAGRGPRFDSRNENVLKIGFLNSKVDEFLNSYMNNFDIILIYDESFDIPNAILRFILN